MFAATIVLWQLRGGTARQRLALRAIAGSFLVMAAYITVPARDLLAGSDAGESPIGIVLNVVTLAVMVPVAKLQGSTGRALHNDVLGAQARETWISNALSVNVLIGLGLNAVLGWAWADPLVALVIAAFTVYAGIGAWREAAER